MSNTAMWALIVGFLLPWAISIIQQSHWSNGLRAVVAFFICVLAAVGQILVELNGHWNWHDWITSVLLILVTAISTYNHFWKPTGSVPALERATSGRRSPPPPRN